MTSPLFSSLLSSSFFFFHSIVSIILVNRGKHSFRRKLSKTGKRDRQRHVKMKKEKMHQKGLSRAEREGERIMFPFPEAQPLEREGAQLVLPSFSSQICSCYFGLRQTHDWQISLFISLHPLSSISLHSVLSHAASTQYPSFYSFPLFSDTLIQILLSHSCSMARQHPDHSGIEVQGDDVAEMEKSL